MNVITQTDRVLQNVLLYASAHFGGYYCMDIYFWYSGVYNVHWSKTVEIGSCSNFE